MLDLEFPDDLYLRFRNLLLRRCGLDYPPTKRADLLHSLSQALRATGLANLHLLYAQAVLNPQIWETLICHVTIGETYFFRNTPQFTALREHILPEIVARRASGRGIRCWSAGCATGEEPYSLAITLCDLLPDLDTWLVSILATDINRDFLARAQVGVYSAWAFRETPVALRERYFTAASNRWRLQPAIRRMVQFKHLNLVESSYPAIANGTSALDLILCRNVTIYFHVATTRQIVARLYDSLAPGGWLVVGHAEPHIDVYQQFEVHNFPNAIIYRKPLNAPLFPLDAQNGTVRARVAPRLGSTPGMPAPPSASQQSRNEATPAYQDSPPAAPVAQPMPQHLVHRARQFADRGDWEAVDQTCRRALEYDPLCRDAHYLLARMYEHRGEFKAALTAYRGAVYLDRSFVPGIIGMAQMWQTLGRPVEARRFYRNALKQLALLPPTSEMPHADSLTYADVTALVLQQLQALNQIA